MIRTVDRLNDQVVQKVVSPYGKTLRYQYGIPGKGMTEVSTLSEARMGIGKLPPASVLKPGWSKLTLPSHA